MIESRVSISIWNFMAECIGVLFFYRQLEKRSDSKVVYLGYCCLLLLTPCMFRSSLKCSSSKDFVLENLFNQIIRTFITLMAIYGYLGVQKIAIARMPFILSSVYVLIYMVSFNLRQACLCRSSPICPTSARVDYGRFHPFSVGHSSSRAKASDLKRIKDVGYMRFGVIGISIVVELYFKFSIIANDGGNLNYPTDLIFYSLSSTIGVFIMVILFERNITYHEKRAEMQLEQVQMQYEMQNARRYLRANADIRRLYHDMKNHLLALESMIKSGGEPEQYITELRSRLESYDVNVNTGNAVADTLLAEKIERARLDNISFNVCADLSMFSFMNSVDMVTILANAIDNAVEALIQLPEGQERIVYIKTTRYANMAVLRISNQFSGKLDLRDGVLHTGKADPAMHGIGLSSIQKAVKRYGGSAETQFENDGGWFRLMIMIPVPEK